MCHYCGEYLYYEPYKVNYCSRECYRKHKLLECEHAVENLPQLEREYLIAKQKYNEALKLKEKLSHMKKRCSSFY